MYGVVRRYCEASALNDALAQNKQEVEDLISGVSGFVAYYAVRSGNGLATITICDDKEGTQESTRRAASWVKEQKLPSGPGNAPEVTEGEIFLHFGK